ncbi:hypothetical protein ESZ36_20315 [Colwellia demingiae]|uniref:Uncharacterized protein n=1 Tax=Colwellia demingiae TaxID=89401 RepID=A0A5C6Q6I1_9GAMM|nr:hypothetical protein [Colwellia demingiae]TWX64321.1 hypothetical protein ESZ36_20315 [Colwellia demingiae]
MTKKYGNNMRLILKVIFITFVGNLSFLSFAALETMSSSEWQSITLHDLKAARDLFTNGPHISSYAIDKPELTTWSETHSGNTDTSIIKVKGYTLKTTIKI